MTREFWRSVLRNLKEILLAKAIEYLTKKLASKRD